MEALDRQGTEQSGT